jgi:glucose/mannose-6-phosphate isomerase
MPTTLSQKEIARIDRDDMAARIAGFPAQAREGVAIGRAARISLRTGGLKQIVFCGLGGSAIAGDLLRSLLADQLRIPFIVNRHYSLPKSVGPDSLVIVSSYSGNTEETNAAHREALRRKARILCITSGGTTALLAKRRRTPCIIIPGGSPPRAALAYSFFPLLIVLGKLGLIRRPGREIAETLALCEAKAAIYRVPDAATNPALRLAESLAGRITVIYSSTGPFEAVNTRWRGQIAENAKALSFGHVLPEMNHNELVGWEVLRDQMREMAVLFLRDREDHPRVAVRIDVTRGLLGQVTPHVHEVWSEGTSRLARLFSLVHLGDWVSYYLALLHGVDPTPVAAIDHLKRELAAL